MLLERLWSSRAWRAPRCCTGPRLRAASGSRRSLQERVTEALSVDARRVTGKRGFSVLHLTEMPAVICELAFGTHPSDAWALLTGQADLLQAYRTALTTYLNEPPA